MRAQVIVLAGPSGAGKSRLAERTGLPVLRLDDFYKSGDDPTLPIITEGANAGIVDWDVPESWLPGDALAALEELCRTGRAEVPVYDIARNGRCGARTLDLGDHHLFIAEGIFAQEVVGACGDAGMLAAAYCVRQHPMVTFWRRLTRDLREHRKPPLVLLRRGLALMRDQQRVVSHAVERGCTPVSPDRAYAAIGRLAERDVSRDTGPMTTWPRQPDSRTCGPSSVVVAEALRAGGAAGPWPRFEVDVLAMHRRLTGVRDRHGRLQLPWPRMFGTPPWAVARELGGRVRRYRRPEVVAALPAPVPVFLGSRWLPRHVVLVLDERDGEPLAYNPARGAVEPLSSSRWKRTWWAVLPR